jgi:hypothetical protein
MPTPRWILFKDWLAENATPLIMIGVVVFVCVSVGG